MTVTVGFAGLGRMGSQMARNIARAGFPLTLYTTGQRSGQKRCARSSVPRPRRPPKSSPGAVTSSSPCLPMARRSRRCTLGDEGLIAGLGSGKVAVEMSTVGPELIGALAEPVAATGAELVDAPVSGSVGAAEGAALMIMVGGSEESVAVVRPVLEAVGSNVLHVGPSGAGATIKLAVNLIVFGFNQALSEALVLAERAGVDLSTAYDVFAASAMAAPALIYRRPAFENPEETPVTFTLDLAAKDLQLVMAMAERVGAPMPQTRENLAVLERASAAGFGEDDMAAVAQFLRAG